MDKLVDYTKYTLALAVGLLLYIPANFIPADATWKFIVLLVILGLLVISILAGIALYSRATKLLVADKDATTDEKGWTRLWGNIHLWLLIGCFAATTPFFFYIKIWSPVPTLECKLSVKDDAGNPIEISIPCKSNK